MTQPDASRTLSRRPGSPPVQEPVPEHAQPTLPFADSALDAPIPYGLTARARRVVAPSTLPDLAVLPGKDGNDFADQRFDTRPARARALRRSGRNLPEIAAELEVGEEFVAAWTRDVMPRRRSRTRRSTSWLQPVGDSVAAALEPRAAAVDNDELAAVGFVLGLAEVTTHALTIATTDPVVARSVVRWLQARVGVHAARLRVTLTTGPAVARDLTAHRWAEAVGIPVESVVAAPWPDAPEPTAVRARLRVADPQVAATVMGWRAALLTGSSLPSMGQRQVTADVVDDP